ncbi:Hypothetical Protein FCC1311_096382 [Hondaea fermentalgiana]|uniref:C2H2-type domain-containing protein n=1 Tax=Hondaea fermentalgiana TaxID=2315210 RepID=A0A2R5GS45_9STRA|nr:Hypothetical Protein FCC1311_096382 [Hondaea fermentalgiana]|eukprot:GBG33415.1 Hypothetical Protein FCC1311_096382 [Hondaea fermentalgiana]
MPQHSSQPCGGCGYQILRSQVSSMQRWGAACRYCARKGLTQEEHKAYLRQLEENDPKLALPPGGLGEVAKSAVEILARGEELSEEDVKKLALERVETAKAVKVDAPAGAGDQVEKLQCPFPKCKRVFILRGKLATHVVRIHRVELLNALTPYVEEMNRSSDSDSGRGRKRRAGLGSSSGESNRRTSSGPSSRRERSQYQMLDTAKLEYDLELPKQSHEHHLGFTLDNLVRWDDNSRTRLGLLPLQPPQGSGAFETGPHRMFRLAMQGNKVSQKWNMVLDDDEETVFGMTNAELCYQHAPQLGLGRRQRTKRAQARRKRARHGQGNGVGAHGGSSSSNSNNAAGGGGGGGDDGDANVSAAEDADDDSSTGTGGGDKFMTGLDMIRLLRPPPRQVFQCSLDGFSRSAFAHVRETSEDGCLYDLSGSRMADMAPRRMLPAPSRQPRPPSMSDLEETAWVTEAGRLMGVARRRRDPFFADGDPFEKIGLKPLSRKESVGIDRSEEPSVDVEARLEKLAPAKLSLLDAHRQLRAEKEKEQA